MLCVNLPSTDGEKIIKWSYRNWPYLIKDREGSSAVLNVRSKPRSERGDTLSEELKHRQLQQSGCSLYSTIHLSSIFPLSGWDVCYTVAGIPKYC